jgi:AbrB family looped-hinge helix DNA binding protein
VRYLPKAKQKAIGRARVSSKGQITIPKAVRDEFALRAGDEIEFLKEDGHIILRRFVPDSLLDPWVGYLKEWEGYDVDELIEEMRGR